jgi:hypothetical protein
VTGTARRPVVAPETLQAVVTNRYDVLAKYGKLIKRIYTDQLRSYA